MVKIDSRSIHDGQGNIHVKFIGHDSTVSFLVLDLENKCIFWLSIDSQLALQASRWRDKARLGIQRMHLLHLFLVKARGSYVRLVGST